jgi:hypothetical protein
VSKRSADGAASPNLTAKDLVSGAAVRRGRKYRGGMPSSGCLVRVDRVGHDRVGRKNEPRGCRRSKRDGCDAGYQYIEQTSFVLDLLWECAEPIVVTGAMRHSRVLGTDGPANLLASAVVAASASARYLGSVVALGPP